MQEGTNSATVLLGEQQTLRQYATLRVRAGDSKINQTLSLPWRNSLSYETVLSVWGEGRLTLISLTLLPFND